MNWDSCPYVAMIDIRNRQLFRRRAFLTEEEAKAFIKHELNLSRAKKRGVHLQIKNILNGRIILDERCDEV